MTSPAHRQIGSGLRFERTYHNITWLPRPRIIVTPVCKANYRVKLEYSTAGEGKFALPKTLYLAAIIGESPSKIPGKALMQCAMNSPAREAFPPAQATNGL